MKKTKSEGLFPYRDPNIWTKQKMLNTASIMLMHGGLWKESWITSCRNQVPLMWQKADKELIFFSLKLPASLISGQQVGCMINTWQLSTAKLADSAKYANSDSFQNVLENYVCND